MVKQKTNKKIMENNILESIRKQLFEINNLSSDDRYFYLSQYVGSVLNDILKLIKLADNKEKKQIYKSRYDGLYLTLDKEVWSAKNAFNKAKKKNARPIRINEYNTILKNAIQQINFELSSLMSNDDYH
ncbi:MAG: hypothetical protein DRI89_09185 [Bacteroidetes bacterium]|nr:MAG: hypothetical protein DRI89_09185 [Bacteroidota bacterium]